MSFKARVSVLLLVLAGAAGWAGWVKLKRGARVNWERPLTAGVVLVSTEPVAPEVLAAWENALPRLREWMRSEMSKYRAPPEDAAQFFLGAPVQVESLPQLEAPSNSFSDRTQHALGLSKQLAEISKRAQLPAGRYDLKLFVVLTPAVQREGRVEGIGARGGELGVVRAPATAKSLDLELIALAHELFHCLGAEDAYDEAGHCVEPKGLAEPTRTPLYPQSHAEVMCGETPRGPGSGAVPETLEQVVVGPFTAARVRWIE